MLTRSDSVLADGARISGLVNLEAREVKMQVLSDAELYQLEMEKTFAKAWVCLAHETEIPNSGDFVERDTGSDSVLVTRDREGKLHVVLNVCTHRGMKVSTLDMGNMQAHMCIYHGWASRPNGDFIGAPVEKECICLMLSRSRFDFDYFDMIPCDRHDVLRKDGDTLQLARREILIYQSVIGTPNLAIFL